MMYQSGANELKLIYSPSYIATYSISSMSIEAAIGMRVHD